jgi:hypothetical protein
LPQPSHQSHASRIIWVSANWDGEKLIALADCIMNKLQPVAPNDRQTR